MERKQTYVSLLSGGGPTFPGTVGTKDGSRFGWSVQGCSPILSGLHRLFLLLGHPHPSCKHPGSQMLWPAGRCPADTKGWSENRERVFPAGPGATHSWPWSLLLRSSSCQASLHPGLCWEDRGRKHHRWSGPKTPLFLLDSQDLADLPSTQESERCLLSPAQHVCSEQKPKDQMTLTTGPHLSPALFGKQPLLAAVPGANLSA